VTTYTGHGRTLMAICAKHHVDLDAPLSEQDLFFVVAVYASTHKFSTVDNFISGVRHFMKERWSSPTFTYELPRGHYYTTHYAGLKHYYGNTATSTPKIGLTLSDLCEFITRLDLHYFEHSRDWCACLFAFFGLLRINEYMGGGLRHQHVTITQAGVDITILYSKTTQTPTTISLTRRDDLLCPLRAYRHLLDSTRHNGLEHDANTPVFLTRTFPTPHGKCRVTAMVEEEFIARVRALLKAAFPTRDASRYAGHSFRRGGASALLLAGVDPASIQRHGRWASDAWRKYIDAADNPAVRLIATRALLRRRK
jgi:hypothetical protein